ncbi:MAG TPA: alpha/beta hydrolase [Terracidiphilus sp.]|nr:alpha/beta hydrolase [Terracidiphilus sp.]
MSASLNAINPYTIEEMATNVGPAHIDICYQRLGDSSAPPVVLIMGGAAQMIHWPDPFCRALVDRGLQVIRFDNRDSGRSTQITNAPPPDLPAVLAGDNSSASYTLSDMAADTVGLLDFLGIESAHIAGASMGGQIAQTIALEHPTRVRSLISMMSSTGSMSIGQPTPEAMRQLFGGPPAVTREDVIKHRVMAMKAVGSPDYPSNEEELAATAGRAWDRSFDLTAIARQAIATVASGDRAERLRNLKVPTLVIHGLADRMCDVSGGRAVAEAIPGSELILIEGMGHSLAPGLRPILANHIADFVGRVERRGSA